MNFTSFQLHPKIMAGIQALGYTTPTPIQVKAIPLVLSGSDVMGLAQTGTGKTAAFGLPILHRLLSSTSPRRENSSARALIIAPTRELAEQIHEAIQEMGQKTGVRSATIYGGVPMKGQIRNIRNGLDIIVACPGRLLDHIESGSIKLDTLEVLVLDEADHMFDMGFLPTIRKILRYLPKKRQTLMFSATMPTDIRKLANEVLQNPQTVEIGRVAPATTVTHALYAVEQNLKTSLLLELIKTTDTESILIFTRTKHRAKSVGNMLEQEGYRATSLQGNLSQNRRQAALDGFREGKYQILVATDIAARGIDVSQISHVINFDIPDTAEAYTHRIGRTGRAAKTGDAFTFVSREDLDVVRMIEKALNTKIERRTLEGFDYTATGRRGEFNRPPRPSNPRRRAPDARTSGRREPNAKSQPKAQAQGSRFSGNRRQSAGQPLGIIIK